MIHSLHVLKDTLNKILQIKNYSQNPTICKFMLSYKIKNLKENS
jgi:hypothetical protein